MTKKVKSDEESQEEDPLNPKMGNSFSNSTKNLDSVRYYFASRNSTFEEIWNIAYRLSDEIGEQILDIFILTLIDHWDNEKERFVLLGERCLITMEYDFERLEIKQMNLYDYSRFDSIRIGTLCYPEISFNSSCPHRSKLGIRFIWDSKKLVQTVDRWNPWSKDIPWITLSSHPIQYYIEQIMLDSQHQQPDSSFGSNGFNQTITQNRSTYHYPQQQQQQQSSSNIIAPTTGSNPILDDPYFTVEYLNQIKYRFSLEIFHDKLFEILNSFQSCRIPIPKLMPLLQEQMEPEVLHISNNNNSRRSTTQQLFELYHPDGNVTIVHYAPIVCENYFNITATIFNRTRMGYYRLRLF